MSEITEKPVIGITMGDYNGIGPEVILKALHSNQMNRICTPVVYGSMKVLNRYRNLLDMKDWQLANTQSAESANPKLTNVVTCFDDKTTEIEPGKVTTDAGKAAFECLKQGASDLKAGKIAALVTAPINKKNIQSEDFAFPGHTEYLADAFGVKENLMFLVSEDLRVAVVTGHIPLAEVAAVLTRDKITKKINLLLQSLRKDFGIRKPRIAVLGLNPHAGEDGLLGSEDAQIIRPAVQDFQNKGHLVFGPLPADGFFGTQQYKNYDAVLAMYHDQGLIPFKTIAFEQGVNFTAGMPAVRTSPDHGTAYDIAGKNQASEVSMLEAIYAAIDITRNRAEQADLEKNALKKQDLRAILKGDDSKSGR